MSEGFNNPVVGGNAFLIRPAIKSPNYVSGTSGWTINQDGTAEFNNVTLRGNAFFDGSQQLVAKGIFWTDGVTSITQPFIAETTAGIHIHQLMIAAPGDSNGNQSGIEFNGNDTVVNSSVVTLGGGLSGIISGPVQWENNTHAGRQYYEEWKATLNQPIASGVVVTVLYDTQVQLDSPSYGSAYNSGTGVWTCPADGYYTISARVKGDTFGAACPRDFFRIFNVTAALEYAGDERSLQIGAIMFHTLTVGPVLVLSGTQLRVDYFQNSGAARNIVVQTVANHVSFKRHL